MTVAALYVEKDGPYFGLPDVDPWDAGRDARLYDGPHPRARTPAEFRAVLLDMASSATPAPCAHVWETWRYLLSEGPRCLKCNSTQTAA